MPAPQELSLRTFPEFSFEMRVLTCLQKETWGIVAMNSSQHGFDRATHCRILAVAVFAALTIVIIGNTAQLGGSLLQMRQEVSSAPRLPLLQPPSVRKDYPLPPVMPVRATCLSMG